MDVQACRLTKIDGLDKILNLESLHISHNQIEKIENLDQNSNIETLDVSGNPIKSLVGKNNSISESKVLHCINITIEGLEPLSKIEDLWMNDCSIAEWKEIEYLKGLKLLRTIYLERNPIFKDTMYRKKIMLTLPQGKFL